MLDLNFVRENLPLVEEKLRQRGMDPAAVLKDFREVDTQRRQAITEAETSKAQRNKASEEIAKVEEERAGRQRRHGADEGPAREDSDARENGDRSRCAAARHLSGHSEPAARERARRP